MAGGSPGRGERVGGRLWAPAPALVEDPGPHAALPSAGGGRPAGVRGERPPGSSLRVGSAGRWWPWGFLDGSRDFRPRSLCSSLPPLLRPFQVFLSTSLLTVVTATLPAWVCSPLPAFSVKTGRDHRLPLGGRLGSFSASSSPGSLCPCIVESQCLLTRT